MTFGRARTERVKKTFRYGILVGFWSLLMVIGLVPFLFAPWWVALIPLAILCAVGLIVTWAWAILG